LRFTLSHPVTAALPPGDETLFSLALKVSDGLTPFSKDEVESIKDMGLKGNPLFKYPMS